MSKVSNPPALDDERGLCLRAVVILVCASMVFFVSGMFGCRRSANAQGNFLVRFRWDSQLLQAEVIGQSGPITGTLRQNIIRVAEPSISGQVKRANLKSAEGEIQFEILDNRADPIVRMARITEPDISQFFAAVEMQDDLAIRQIVRRYHNVDQRDLTSLATPLFMAAAGAKAKSVATLLDLGADPNIPNHAGDTALHVAVLSNGADCVQMLIEHRAEINVRDDQGVTPLMRAAQLNSVDIVRRLLRAGADANAKAADGKTALEFAKAAGARDAAALLAAHART